jgi:hypothetical protein
MAAVLRESCAMKLSLSQLRAKAKYRPPGYVEDVLSRGKMNGDLVELDDAVFEELRIKYKEPERPALDVMAKGFFRSVAWWIANGVPVAPKRVFLARRERCESNVCGQWLGDRKVARCAACGCSTGV